MSVLIVLIIIGVLVAGGFLAGFIWAVKSGQYDDTDSPAVRILFDDVKPEKKDDANSGIHSEKEELKQKNNDKPRSN